MIRGRAGRRAPKNPRSLRASRHEGDPDSDNRRFVKVATSRTRCLIGLLHTAPGGFTFFRPFRALSTAGRGTPARRRWHGTARVWPTPHAMHSSVQRDRMAWAAGTRSDVSFRPGTGHRSPSRVRHTADAPRMGRDAPDIALLHGIAVQRSPPS